MTAVPYRARTRHALEAVSDDGKTVTIEAALDVIPAFLDEFVKEIVADVYAEKSSD
jgi:hypothetical protein